LNRIKLIRVLPGNLGFMTILSEMKNPTKPFQNILLIIRWIGKRINFIKTISNNPLSRDAINRVSTSAKRNMTDKYNNKYRIPSARLQHWDYGANANYFITVCTYNREHYFGDVIDKKMQLSPVGELAQKYWQEMAQLKM